MPSPTDRKYLKSHEWVKTEDGVSVIGLSEFAIHAIKDIVYLELPDLGRKLESGKPFGIIESVKAVFDLYSPLSGEVLHVNSALQDNFDPLTQDPYGKGWLIKVKGLASGAELMDSAAYDKHCAEDHH